MVLFGLDSFVLDLFVYFSQQKWRMFDCGLLGTMECQKKRNSVPFVSYIGVIVHRLVPLKTNNWSAKKKQDIGQL
jgi:hypothetical protein